jgi:hypothetical protein
MKANAAPPVAGFGWPSSSGNATMSEAEIKARMFELQNHNCNGQLTLRVAGAMRSQTTYLVRAPLLRWATTLAPLT